MFHIKGERKKFLRNYQRTSHAVIFGQRTFFSIIKLAFREKKHEPDWVYVNVNFKDCVLFKKSLSNIEIDFTVIQKHMSF